MTKISRKRVLQGFRRRSLLDATRRLIAKQGFDAATMELVARDAGITKGAIYLYFRNKDQMILAALEETAAEMLREIETRVNSLSEPWEQLCELIRAQMAIMEQNRELLRTLLIDRRLMKDSPGGSRARRLLKYKRRHEAGIRRLLESGMRRRVFRPLDAARAAFYINELTVSTAQKRLLGLTRSSVKVETEALIRFVGLLLREEGGGRALKECL
jgi:AcrR family transcriptional regulator